MPTRLLASLVLLLTACARSSTDTGGPARSPSPTAAATSPAGGAVLPEGRSAEALAPGRWRSPAPFAPAMTVTVGSGWRSAHGFPDMFDVVRPEPGSDVPRIGVAFTVAAGDDPAAVVRAIRGRAGGAAGRVSETTLAGSPATSFDVRGGTGELYRSVTGGYGLHARSGQRLRIVVGRAGGVVLVAVVTAVPDRNWAVELPEAQAVLRSARLA